MQTIIIGLFIWCAVGVHNGMINDAYQKGFDNGLNQHVEVVK